MKMLHMPLNQIENLALTCVSDVVMHRRQNDIQRIAPESRLFRAIANIGISFPNQEFTDVPDAVRDNSSPSIPDGPDGEGHGAYNLLTVIAKVLLYQVRGKSGEYAGGTDETKEKERAI
jgi:hypothetical protein